MTIRGQGTLAERQQEMRERMRKQKEAANKPLPVDILTPDEKKELEDSTRTICISCHRRVARQGSSFCSRCSVSGLQQNLRDTLPGAIIAPPPSTPPPPYPPPPLPQSSQVENPEFERLEHEQQLVDFQPAAQDGEQKYYTRQQVADMVGVSCTTISRWESKGKTPQPRRLRHNNQCLYSDDVIKAIKEYASQEYIPQVTHPVGGVDRIRTVAKKSPKLNRGLERAVANRIGLLGKKVF